MRMQRTVRLVLSTSAESTIELNDVANFNAQSETLMMNLAACITSLDRLL